MGFTVKFFQSFCRFENVIRKYWGKGEKSSKLSFWMDIVADIIISFSSSRSPFYNCLPLPVKLLSA